MVKIVFEYEILADDRDAYLRETSEKVKPFWESQGCKGYFVWQEAENENRFVKEMLFDDAAALKKTMNLEEAEPYKSIFRQFAKNVSRKVVVQKL